jgi:hypothetical protein
MVASLAPGCNPRFSTARCLLPEPGEADGTNTRTNISVMVSLEEPWFRRGGTQTYGSIMDKSKGPAVHPRGLTAESHASSGLHARAHRTNHAPHRGDHYVRLVE